MHVGVAAPVPARPTVPPLSAPREPSVILVLLSTLYSLLPKQSTGPGRILRLAPGFLSQFIYLYVSCLNPAGLRCSSYTPRKHPHRTVPLSHFPSRWLFYPNAHISPVHFTQFLSCKLLGEVCPGHLNKFLLSAVPSSSLNSLGFLHGIA